MKKEESVFIYRDRDTGQLCREKLFASVSLHLLYGESKVSRSIGALCHRLTTRSSMFSHLVGWWYRRPKSRKLITSFIQTFDVKASEFASPVESFASFNDFFIRQLKKEARPIAEGSSVAVMPADGRYLFYPDLTAADGWIVKNKKFCLTELVGDASLAKRYLHGTMVIARLCPSDYHRFHFPCECLPSEARLLNGYLHSVHPLALCRNIDILAQNKRFLTQLKTEKLGTILDIEIGAVGVGSVVQTYQPDVLQQKGSEKGYFQFGGSCVILLFEPNTLVLDEDLLSDDPHVEVRCLMGQSLGKAL